MNDKIGALALAISTTIGAGVLGLPKALYLVGPLGIAIATMVALFLLISALMLSDMLKREKRPIQIPALIAEVLGERWKYFVYLTLIFSMYGALSAYHLGFGIQLNTLMGIPEIAGGLVLFFIGSYLIYRGTKMVEEIATPLAMALIVFLLGLSVLNIFSFQGFEFAVPNLGDSLKFTGTIMFALFGLNVLPEINFLTKGKPMNTYILSTVLCLVLYLGFSFTTVAVLGESTTALGTSGLAQHYGGMFNLVISLFTVTALFSSFLGIGLSMMHIYQFDFKFPRIVSTLLVVTPPLTIFLLSGPLNISFLDILGIAGELTLPLFAITVAYAYYKIMPAIKPRVPLPKLTTFITAGFYATIFTVSLANLIL